MPSWPSVLEPQHHRLRSNRRAQVWWSPTATFRHRWPPLTGTACWCGSVSPTPGSLLVFELLHHRWSTLRIVHLCLAGRNDVRPGLPRMDVIGELTVAYMSVGRARFGRATDGRATD